MESRSIQDFIAYEVGPSNLHLWLLYSLCGTANLVELWGYLLNEGLSRGERSSWWHVWGQPDRRGDAEKDPQIPDEVQPIRAGRSVQGHQKVRAHNGLIAAQAHIREWAEDPFVRGCHDLELDSRVLRRSCHSNPVVEGAPWTRSDWVHWVHQQVQDLRKDSLSWWEN